MNTILVVDDDPAVRNFIGNTLRDLGLTVLTAHRLDAALSEIISHGAAIDLAIVDMIMPGGSGLDLAAELGRQWDGIQVLYVSGHHDSVAMDSIAQRSPEQVLLKPFSDQQLIARVLHLLARRQIEPYGSNGQLPRVS
jgi:DNA-binding response OmpR family regulator